MLGRERVTRVGPPLTPSFLIGCLRGMRVIRHRWLLCHPCTYVHAGILHTFLILYYSTFKNCVHSCLNYSDLLLFQYNQLKQSSNNELWKGCSLVSVTLGTLIITWGIFRPLNMANFKKQSLYVVVIDRIEGQLFCYPEAFTSKASAQLKPVHIVNSLPSHTLFFFCSSVMFIWDQAVLISPNAS